MENIKNNKTHVCNVCAKAFGRRYNLERHIKSIHSSSNTDKNNTLNMSSKYDRVTDNESTTEEENTSDNDEYSNSLNSGYTSDIDETMSSDEDIDPWEDIINEAYKHCKQKFVKKVKSYMNKYNEVSEDNARKIVFNEMSPIYTKAAMRAFGEKLEWFNLIRRDRIYKAIKATAKKLEKNDDFKKTEAIKYAIRKRRFLFEKLLKKIRRARHK